MLAVGVGIAPMLQALHSLLTTEGEATRLVLLYGNRSVKDILMRSAAPPAHATHAGHAASSALHTHGVRSPRDQSRLALLVVRLLSVLGVLDGQGAAGRLGCGVQRSVQGRLRRRHTCATTCSALSPWHCVEPD